MRIGTLTRGLAAKLAFLNRKLTGGDISISMTATDRSYDEAMAAIEHFRPIRWRQLSFLH